MVPKVDEETNSILINSFFEPIVAEEWANINYINVIALQEDREINFSESASIKGRSIHVSIEQDGAFS
jgi:hypothetical protein